MDTLLKLLVWQVLGSRSREMPFEVAATGPDGSCDSNTPNYLAISPDGMVKSLQIAPECTLLKADSFEIGPPGLPGRRKQQIDVFFLYLFDGEAAIIWK